MEITPSFLQTLAWERVQQKLGRKTYWLDETLFINYDLRFGKSYWYAPRIDKVPSIETIDQVFKENSIFVKVEPQAIDLEKPWQENKTRQPRQTLLLDLTKSEDALLAQMKPKTRYNIRLAARKGVKVFSWNYPESLDYLPYFLQQTKETNLRDQISSHHDDYYKSVLEELGKEKMASLVVAFFEDKPICSMILIRHAGTATYLFGASTDDNRETMATYLIQWEAIKLAKAAGDKVYDFWGVRVDERVGKHIETHDGKTNLVQPTPGKSFGVTRFKLGFGGIVHQYPHAFDRSYSGIWYSLYRGASSISSSSSFSF